MKIVHVEVKTDVLISFSGSFLASLPGKIGLFTTAQYAKDLKSIKRQLEASGKEVVLFQTRHTPVPGQLLGCNVQSFPGVDAFLYIGDGLFHPKALLAKNKKPVFTYDPLTKKSSVLDMKEAELEERKRSARLSLFARAKDVGVLISVKSGQYGIVVEKEKKLFGMERYFALSTRFPDKNFYFLAADDISLQGLPDFNFLDFLVNTACPRIAIDDYEKSPVPMLNLDDIEGGVL
ncbi:MAG: diphthamide synthesis protein [Nanoarchaeota archaeon]